MSNMILATPVLSDAATVTSSTAVGAMTVNNLQKRSLNRIWRITDLSTGYVAIDFGSATTVNLIALIGHNGSASGTVTVKGGTTSAVTDYSSGALSLITGTDQGYDQNIFVHNFGGGTYRYWKLEFSDASNADGYLQAGRLYMSMKFQPDVNISYNLAEGFIDNSRISRTINGEPVPLRRDPYRFVEFSLDFGSETEMYGTLYDVDRLRGSSKDVLYISDPEATTHYQRRYVYGLMTDLKPIVNRNFQIFQKSYRIEEIP